MTDILRTTLYQVLYDEKRERDESESEEALVSRVHERYDLHSNNP